MTITESSKNGVRVLRLSGRFDFGARHEFQAAVARAKQGKERQVILNLQEVPFMDSAALGMLANMHQQLTATHIHMSLASPQGYVKKILDLANMGKYFSINATEEPAPSMP